MAMMSANRRAASATPITLAAMMNRAV